MKHQKATKVAIKYNSYRVIYLFMDVPVPFTVPSVPVRFPVPVDNYEPWLVIRCKPKIRRFALSRTSIVQKCTIKLYVFIQFCLTNELNKGILAYAITGSIQAHKQ